MLNYLIMIYKVKIKGQRKRYAWTVEAEEDLGFGYPDFIECGDSFYIFNARRAADRAAKRHSAGTTTVSEVQRREIYL